MIKHSVINNLRFGFGITALFLVAFLLKINLLISAFLLVLFFYLKIRNSKMGHFNLLHVLFLFIVNFASGYFVVSHHWPLWYVPFAAYQMLASLLFNNLELSLLLTIASGASLASLAGNHLHLSIFFFVSGILANILVLEARRRSTIIRAGVLVGAAHVVLFFFLSYFSLNRPVPYLTLFLNGVISGIITIGILPVFEYLFKTVTNISLLELADFNHPLLQRMTLEAPGTYHHSLVVGNLADAACRVVGANALLARIGAYYHDVGKLQKPGYFSENQDIQHSKHDALSPTMSKLVIMNHVKEGVELAQHHKIHPRIINFIEQHHGNSLVYYFYRRALESREDGEQQVAEEGFRYPGPKPNTKETAIVLLADSVEAATRALKDPQPSKIEELVHKIINNKFIDAQLDECELTLKDLEKIAAVFIRILSGIYHSRVVYPESQRSENNHKKPAKENSSQPNEGKEGSA